MADRSISITLQANIAGYMASLRTAGAATKDFGDKLRKNQQMADSFGRGMIAFGATVVGGLALATRAAVQWESAWTGVEKTVDGNARQMAVLEGQLRGLARELPATHEEIASVAEAAGQLGIKRQSIAEFTKTMIDLSETTNLTADEAATSFAQLANVMGTSQSEFDRMGSTVVALGNAGASTERDIVALAQRLSGAGKLMGASEPEILALASAMADLGIEAELGGGAIQRTAIKIESAVQDGGDALEGFADVAGMSASRFATMYENRPIEAINAFIQGLNRIDRSGGNVVAALAELGIKGTQDLSVLLRLKGAGDLLTRSLGLGAKAWRENTALVEEAAKRYQTTEARMQIARNNINDLGITVGEMLVPVLGAAADKVSGFVSMIQDLPEPVKRAAGFFGGLLGSVSLVGGAALMAAPRVHRFRQSLEAMGGLAARANSGLGALGRFMIGPWGIALGVATVAVGKFASSKAEAEQRVRRFTEALEADNGVLGAHTREAIAATIAEQDLVRVAEEAKVPLDVVARAIGGDADAMDELKRRTAEAGEEITLTSGIRMPRLTKAGGELIAKTQLLNGEVRKGRKEQRLAAEAEKASKRIRDKATQSTKEATKAQQEYTEELRKSTDPVFALFSALEDVDRAQRTYNRAVNKFGAQSPQARQAATELAKAVSAAEQAALDGDLSFADFKAQLKTWVKQGVLTAKQAKAVEERVRFARKEAERYTGHYRATIEANTKPAERTISNFITQQEKRKIGIAITSGQLGGGGKLVTGGFAAGGFVSGPGGPRDDMIPARLSDGEFVVNAASTKRNRALLEAINARGFANGGMVQAEDGSWVPRSFYNPTTLPVKVDLSGLRDGINSAIEELRSSFFFGGAPMNVSGNRAIVKSIFANMFGWARYWPQTYALLMKESGFRNTAQNPTSSAYGMFQFLDSTWGGYGIPKTSDPRLQTIAGGRYIRARYGNPAAALAFHLRNNWYADGGKIPGPASSRDNTVVGAATGEFIVNARQTAKHLPLLEAINAGSLGGFAEGGLVKRQKAMREMLRHVRSGGNLFADFSFKGMSNLAKRFNDELAKAFRRTGMRFTRQNVAKFLDARLPDANRKSLDSGEKNRERRERERERREERRRRRSERQINSFGELADRLLGNVKQSDDPLKQQLKRMHRTLTATAQFLRKAEKDRIARRVGDPFRRRITNLLKRRERLDEQLEKARERRDRIVERRREVSGGLRSSIFEGRNMIGGFGIDIDGGFGAGDIAKQLGVNLADAKKFQRLLAEMKRKGFRKDIIAQIAQAGVTEGMSAAEALAGAQAGEVGRINKTFGQIGKFAKGFSKRIGHQLFGAGQRAAQGLINGLRKKRDKIHETMVDIARSLVRAIRRALKIKSPSQEMMAVGDLTGQGFVQGLAKSMPQARHVMDRNVRDLTRLRPFTPNATTGGGPSTVHNHYEVIVKAPNFVGSNADLEHAIRRSLRTSAGFKRDVRRFVQGT